MRFRPLESSGTRTFLDTWQKMPRERGKRISSFFRKVLQFFMKSLWLKFFSFLNSEFEKIKIRSCESLIWKVWFSKSLVQHALSVFSEVRGRNERWRGAYAVLLSSATKGTAQNALNPRASHCANQLIPFQMLFKHILQFTASFWLFSARVASSEPQKHQYLSLNVAPATF